MEYPDRETEKSERIVDGESSSDRMVSETSGASTSDERASLLALSRSGFTRSDTTFGADGKLNIPPLFPIFITAASVLESKPGQKNDLRTAKPGDVVAPTTDTATATDVVAPTTDAVLPAPVVRDLGAERSRLSDLASRSMPPIEYKHLTETMKAFELRAQVRGISEQEVASTYHQVSRLLDETGQTSLTADQRRRLALQVVENAADPTDIPQGSNGTCNVTTVESAVYTVNPSDAARLVADIAITGKHRTRTGVDVASDPVPRTTASEGSASRTDGDRVHASEIFQIAAVNILYTHSGSRLRYDQVKMSAEGDNGERLYRGSEIFLRDPGLLDAEIMKTAELITGHDRIRMVNSDAYMQPNSVVDKVSSAQELNDYLLKAKKEGRLPVIVGVNSGLEPIRDYKDDFHPSRLARTGGHVVTVTDYHPGTPPSINLDNQWARKNDFVGDKKMTVEDLWRVMRPSDKALPIAQQQVESLRAAGVFDPVAESQLLRLQIRYGKYTQSEREAAFSSLWERYTAHCSRSACSDKDQRVRNALALGSNPFY